MVTQSSNLLRSFNPSNDPSDGITIRAAIMTQLSQSFSGGSESNMIKLMKTLFRLRLYTGAKQWEGQILPNGPIDGKNGNLPHLRMWSAKPFSAWSNTISP